MANNANKKIKMSGVLEPVASEAFHIVQEIATDVRNGGGSSSSMGEINNNNAASAENLLSEIASHTSLTNRSFPVLLSDTKNVAETLRRVETNTKEATENKKYMILLASVLERIEKGLQVSASAVDQNTAQVIINSNVQKLEIGEKIAKRTSMRDRITSFDRQTNLNSETNNNSTTNTYLPPVGFLSSSRPWKSFNTAFVFDSNYMSAVTLTTQSPSVNGIINLVPGTSSYQCIGNQLSVRLIDLIVSVTPTFTIVPSEPPLLNSIIAQNVEVCFRVVVVWDFAPNGAAPTFSDIFQDQLYTNNGGAHQQYSSSFSFINVSNFKRFCILEDRFITVPSYYWTNNSGSTTAQYGISQFLSNIRINMDHMNSKNKVSNSYRSMKTVFSSNAVTVNTASIISGQAFLIIAPVQNVVFTNTSSQFPEVAVNTRVYFNDST